MTQHFKKNGRARSRQITRETRAVEKLLRELFPDCPQEFPPKSYRYNPASIRVRLVSERFKGKNRVKRWDMVLPLLKNHLPEETYQDLSLVLLLTPDELEDSMGNLEFENPSPARA